jgi:sugar phosphate isomerase/epimerase
MLYGNCISFKNLQHVKILKETGFDYAETALSPMYAAAKPEIEDFSGALEQSGIECMAANVLFPGDIRLTGEKAEPQKAGDYIGEIFEKTKGLKFKIVVFGSGGARKVPEGFSKESAIEQIAGLIEAHLLPAAEKYGFVLAIEELNRGETNILNSLGECINLAKRANSPKVGLLADLYHIGLENDDIALLPKHNYTYCKWRKNQKIHKKQTTFVVHFIDLLD